MAPNLALMVRRTVKRKGDRAPSTGARRRVVAGASAGPSDGLVALDDRPLRLQRSRDGKRLLVVLPYELLVLNIRDLTVQHRLSLKAPRPTVAEGAEGLLWIGGAHLYRASSWGGEASKIGTRLGGFVDHVALLRPDLLCGAGPQGEILWDTEGEKEAHRRKSTKHEVEDLITTPDERAIWADGSPSAWIIDPAHPSGYTQLRFPTTSPGAKAPAEGIVRLGITTRGRAVLAARDGGVAWTHSDLRLATERFPRRRANASLSSLRPLAVAGDERWIYVLRPRGVLHRFLVEQPHPPAEKAPPKSPSRAGRRPAPSEPEPEPLPEAQTVRLRRVAEAMTLDPGGDGKPQLVLAGAHADGQLGRLWREDPEALEWEDLPLDPRPEAEPEPEPSADKDRPSFVPTRNKVEGEPLSSIKVDDVLAGKTPFWITRDHGTVLERPVARLELDKLLPGDTLVVPAMIRLREGTARPALLLWPGTARPAEEAARPEPRWLTWGDKPVGWMLLDTPQIREQRWSRGDLFPMQVALAASPGDIPGRRAPLPDRWVDTEQFEALARECKKAMKVLW